MEAERLIETGRRALAASRGGPAVMTEAWQAQALARAVGGRLARCGPVELRTEARQLGETGGPGGQMPDHPAMPAPAGGVRAAQLTEVADVRQTLTALGHLLGETGIALVGVACDTEEGLYWPCIEAIDAVDEAVDRVQGMLRRLAAQTHERDREGVHERDGGPGAHAPGAARGARVPRGSHGALSGPAGIVSGPP
ncbi:hypothetical protein CP967_06725 [Streptomyces nitrosporeus]|uniref:Uncharacterized protein n=1 Tax=Streptomyces nitrosporeus TaxID=28894 RepID=A0A5J6F5W2_9ACTN|nr:DUF6099 family protein [Streptomyces nitrosporeus]QEU71691.1 hypothetical protein CP967_06725 [Streptomyces nitrosporeus]GGY95036.1 hypothetical protein GCM10010327_27220 [Streptomyces nitrosporeus]